MFELLLVALGYMGDGGHLHILDSDSDGMRGFFFWICGVYVPFVGVKDGILLIYWRERVVYSPVVREGVVGIS